MALARDLLENEEKENGVMKKSKILIISHDISFIKLEKQKWGWMYDENSIISNQLSNLKDEK